MRKSQILVNSRGLSLAEVLMSTAVLSVLLLIAGSFLGLSINLIGGVNKSSNTDGALKRILHEVRNLSLYAINVRHTTASLDGAASVAGEGYVRSFNYQNSTDLTNPTTPLMFFTREG